MAKKAVATLRDKTATKNVVKCIRMVRSEKSGSYTFKEGVVAIDKEKDFFNGK